MHRHRFRSRSHARAVQSIGLGGAFVAAWLFHGIACFADKPAFQEVRRFRVVEAHQGAAVDETSFFAITNAAIGRYDKKTGRKLAAWKADKERPLTHLNHGIVRDGKLYCAHSNSGGTPGTSSVEVFDARTLRHVGTHSFGIYEGSLTWIDFRDNAWWAVFAHYSHKALRGGGRDTRWTSLVKFDPQWRRTAGWVFPPDVLKKFEPFSCSGGGWGPDGLLYCTGHDAKELYVLQLPKAGSVLRLVRTVPINITGQAFAFDNSQPGVVYGIDRKRSEVVVSKLRK